MEDPGTLTDNLPPESPNKKIKVETVGATHDGDDTDEMEVEEKDDHSENAEDQEMTQTEDSCVTTLQPSPKSTTSTGSTDKPDGVVKNPESPAGDQEAAQSPPEAPPEAAQYPPEAAQSPSEEDAGSTSSDSKEDKETESRHESNGSTDEPDGVIKNPETHAGDQVSLPEMAPPEEPPPEASSLGTSENEVDGDHDEPPQDANKGPEKDTEVESTQSKGSTDKPDGVVKDQESPAGDQGNNRLWGIMGVVLVAVLVPVCLHAFSSQSLPEQKEVRPVDVFRQELKLIQSRFPTQRDELWRRGRIHLERHLQMKHPTEPVSLILTAGRKAEKTLHCLARGLASAFSSAHNASVLHIDGANKAHLDSDQVKLDIDNQLRRAFEGDKPVAVIHRFEELPPGSTLIFYRYCDHENAAYKKTFLIFTVLLADEEELPMRLSLSSVEEMVDDHLKKKFLSAGQPVTFDLMDLDKYSGLWSRISHLILPVAAEKTMELEGCQET